MTTGQEETTQTLIAALQFQHTAKGCKIHPDISFVMGGESTGVVADRNIAKGTIPMVAPEPAQLSTCNVLTAKNVKEPVKKIKTKSRQV